MKKLLMLTAIAVTISMCSNAQYYEYANVYSYSWSNLYPTYIRGVAVDALGRPVVAGDYQPTMSGIESSFVNLPSGVVTYSSNGNSGNFLNTIVADGIGNVYVSGYTYSTSIAIGDTTLVNSGSGIFFIVKYDAAGHRVYVKIKPKNYLYLSVNNAGTILYGSDGIRTYKLNAVTGVNAWNNAISGGRLAQDAANNCYILNGNSLTKLNNNNTVGWVNNSAGGNNIYCGNTNNIFIVSNNTVKKITSSNSLLFTYNLGGNTIVANPSGEFYIGTNDGVYKINSTATNQLWYMGSANISHLAIYGSQEIYMAGQFVYNNDFLLCPFKLTSYSPAGTNNAGYIAKINDSQGPFQAHITTYNPLNMQEVELCVDKPYIVNYDACTNAASTFAANNVFYVELSDAYGSFSNPINIGSPGNVVIPNSITEGSSYRIRVNSTNPPVTGEEVYPHDFSGYYIAPFTSHLMINGPNSLCVNGSVTIKQNGVNGSYFDWYINGVYQDTISNTQDSIIITSPCQVSCKAYHNGCDKISNSIYVTNNMPSAPIIPLGPVAFCSGDSVKLTTNNCTGCTFKWKKNNVNITGAVSFEYTAKTAGKYKVIVTNVDGCSKVSVPLQVTVNCKTGNETQLNTWAPILIYPNPVHDQLHIECPVAQGKTSITIKNILGESVYQNQIETGNEFLMTDINVDFLAQGIYSICVSEGNDMHSSKFIKQ